ncbi:MAG: tetratricopeptide repeat protein [Candidatus Zapsychrus exili]|nr:tetratricopeptide repeat protein [Candidatus Zapsychrus exili]
MKKYFIIILLFVMFLEFDSFAQVNPIREAFEKGLSLYKQKEYKEAVDCFQEAIDLYPQLAAAYNYIALCKKELGASNDEVIGIYQKAIEADSKYAPVNDNLAKFYYSLGNFVKAEEYGLKTLELDPNYITGYLTLGWIYLIGKDKPDVAVSYFKEIANKLKLPYAYFGLGLSYYMGGRIAMVLEVITSLREIKEESFAFQLEAMVRLGKNSSSQRKSLADIINDSSNGEEYLKEEAQESAVSAAKFYMKSNLFNTQEDTLRVLENNNTMSPKDRILELRTEGSKHSFDSVGY